MKATSLVRRVLVPLVVLLALPCAPPDARGDGRGAAGVRWEEGSRAAPDTWTMEDGCPARTGAAESPPLLGAREVAWKFTVQGEVEGEPLAWKGTAVVVERAGTKRTLHVLSTATGVEKAKKTFDTPLPLAPSIADGRILVRSSPKTLTGFSASDKALAARWTFTAKSSVGPATILGDEVYAVVDGTLARLAYGAAAPVWPAAGAAGKVLAKGAPVSAGGAAGAKGGPPPATEWPRPSVRGARVWLATANRLFQVDRADGSVRCQDTLETEVDPATARVAVGLGDVLVSCGRKFKGEGDRDCDTCRFGIPDSGALEIRPSLLLPRGAASVGRDWVGLLAKKGTALSLSLILGQERILDEIPDFATTAVHAEYLESKAPLTASGDLVSIGGRVFDAETYDVLRPDPVPALSRTIPLKDRLLAVEAKNRVVAWKSAHPETPVPPFSALVGDALVAVPASHLALDDGRVVTGEFTFDPKAKTLSGAPKTPAAGPFPAASIAALLSDEEPHRLLLAARPSDVAMAVVAIARTGAGADEPASEADALVHAADSLPAEGTLPYAIALVRAAVDRSPYHAGATAWVRGHLPSGLEPRGLKDIGDWLQFLDLFAKGNLQVFGPKAKDAGSDAVRAALSSARTAWRDDLVGFLDGPLLVVSPPERPGAVARCLVLGRVVSDALDRAFASVGPRRADDDLLVLHLFSSQGEYLNQSQAESGGEPGRGFGGLEHTGGHYDPGANVTRIYFPGEDVRDSVLHTYAHELTHNWIARRRPRRADESSEDRAHGPGYWVVEGFADFVKDFAFDVEAGTGEPSNPAAEYADIVQGTPDAERVPWDKIFSMPQSAAYALLAEGEVKVRLRGRMGTEGTFKKGHLYYAQAASATAYLFLADGGKNRAALFTYLYDYYAGNADPDSILKAVGLSAEDLGAKIVKWCRDLGAPAKPEPPPKPGRTPGK